MTTAIAQVRRKTLAMVVLLSLAPPALIAQMPNTARACGWKDTVPNPMDRRLLVTPETLLVMKRMLLGGRHVELDRRLAAYDSAARADVRNEEAWSAAYRMFGDPDPRMTAPLDEFVRVTRRSDRALVARARHREARSSAARGIGYSYAVAVDTGPDKARTWQTLAAADIDSVVQYHEPHLQAWLLTAQMWQGEEQTVRQAMARALARSPKSVVIREQLQRALRPRWGGSWEAMRAAADSAQVGARNNPRLRTLLGFVWWDRGDVLPERDTVLRLARMNEALKFGDAADFRFERADTYYDRKEWYAALADLECGLALYPWRIDQYAKKGMLLVFLGGRKIGGPGLLMQKEGIKVLDVALELSPSGMAVAWARKEAAEFANPILNWPPKP